MHGHNNVVGATLFPHNIGLGAAGDAELVQRIGAVTAIEVLSTGIPWTFSPTIAVPQDDRWGRTYEGFSEDPQLVAGLGAALAQGYSGEPLSGRVAPGKMVATSKHFIGDGGTKDGKDQGNTVASESFLVQTYGPPYLTTLNEGVQAVMISFSSWNGLKMHGHQYLITDVLKGRMGFDGLVVGDWNGHGQVPGCTNDNCAAAVNAGIDLMMVPEDWRAYYSNMVEHVKKGRISKERLDDAVRRILRVKLRAGLFERGAPSTWPEAQNKQIGTAEHRALAREAVRKSLVLLKNEKNALPIKPSAHIHVVGTAADDIGQQSGGWSISWQGTGNKNSDFPGGHSILDGIKQAVSAAGAEGKVTYSADGKGAESADVTIFVYGETPYAEGEGDIRSVAYGVSNAQMIVQMKSLQARGIPVVSLFLSGRPLWVNPELNASDAFVAAWLPGTQGEGVADVIIGKADGVARHDFSGKLSYSWPKSPSQNMVNKGDPGYAPLFPFGYGLNYAQPGHVPQLDEARQARATDMVGTQLFSGRAKAPWTAYIQEHGKGALIVDEAVKASVSGALEVRAMDRKIQEDAAMLTFKGGQLSGLLLAGGEAMDLSDEAKKGAKLGFDMKIEEIGSDPLYLSVKCGNDCSTSFQINDDLPKAGSDWQRLSVPLQCLAKRKVDLTSVDVPFVFLTQGKAKFGLSNIAIDDKSVSSKEIRC